MTSPRSGSRGVRKGAQAVSMSDLEGLAARRRRAARLFARGDTQAEVARALGVSRESARRWYEVWRAGGAAALGSVGRRGRPAQLSDRDRGRLERALLRGAVAHGFDNDVWTTSRVALVIEDLFGVCYHPGHVWRLLRQMGWTPQRPARRAVERDDEAIQVWVRERWPRAKKTGGYQQRPLGLSRDYDRRVGRSAIRNET